MPQPLVSIVIPTFNAEAFLSETVESILSQTHERIEVVLVDDGSSDGTRDIAERYARRDSRVETIFLDHGGSVRTFAAGTAAARGKYIARMDHDDVACPGRIAVQLDWMTANGVDVCGSQVEPFGADGPALWFPEAHDDICREMLFRCPMIYPTLLAEAPLLKTYSGDPGTVFDDYALLTHLVVKCRLGNVPRSLVKRRRHAAQAQLLLGPEVLKDFRRYRFKLFYAFFPGAPLSDCVAFDRLASRLNLRSEEELRTAGRFMVLLSGSEDPRLRAVMKDRWEKACDRSAELGPVVESIRREHAEKMDAAHGTEIFGTRHCGCSQGEEPALAPSAVPAFNAVGAGMRRP